MNQEFAHDVKTGLTSTPKYLASKYFYDNLGDQLFKAIMQLDEYYLTRAEFEIFNSHKKEILNAFYNNGKKFSLVEFGSGDGSKTKTILNYFNEQNINFKYVPIDISGHILQELITGLKAQFPQMEVEGINDDYFNALKLLNKDDTAKVILFLGSNIGNFRDERALEFLRSLKALMNKDDMLMIGFDLKKDPELIYKAYNDRAGVTRAFNLNLLARINNELGADFDLTKFKHFPLYDPVTGQARSYLVSKEKQTIHIKKINLDVSFLPHEPIHVEISQKYDIPQIETMAAKSGFKVKLNLFDCKHYFVDSVWQLL